MRRAPVRLLTFDLDDTLWPMMPVLVKAEAALLSWFRQLFPLQFESTFGVKELREARIAVLKEKPSLASDFTSMRKEVIRYILCTRCEVSEEACGGLTEQGFQRFIHERNNVEFFPGALEALRELHARGVRLASVTNGNADLHAIGVAGLFCAHVSAMEVGRARPDPAVFLEVFRRTGVSAADVVHIGDDPVTDVETARQLGMHTVWANLLQQRWPDKLLPAQHSFTTWDQLQALLHTNYEFGNPDPGPSVALGAS
eukprot:RCo017370